MVYFKHCIATPTLLKCLLDSYLGETTRRPGSDPRPATAHFTPDCRLWTLQRPTSAGRCNDAHLLSSGSPLPEFSASDEVFPEDNSSDLTHGNELSLTWFLLSPSSQLPLQILNPHKSMCGLSSTGGELAFPLIFCCDACTDRLECFLVSATTEDENQVGLTHILLFIAFSNSMHCNRVPQPQIRYVFLHLPPQVLFFPTYVNQNPFSSTLFSTDRLCWNSFRSC